MWKLLAVGLGGALGAILRYLISLLPLKGSFPVWTLLTNLLGAFVENQLVAMASVLPVSDSHERYRHRGGFGISVLQGYWNQGIASLLIPRVLECAHQAGYEQVELEVLTDNEKAISLYQRHGFREYGCRPHDVKMRDGSYRDALLMLRPL